VKGWLEAAPTPLQMLIAQVQGVNSAAAGYMKAPSAGVWGVLACTHGRSCVCVCMLCGKLQRSWCLLLTGTHQFSGQTSAKPCCI
jgi:hypothetical protein